MILSSENILLLGAVLLIAGVLIGKSGYRTGLLSSFIFLLVGMAFGSDGLGIQFGNMVVAQNIGMVALCIILFTGGMSTSLSMAIRPVLVPGLILSTAGVLLTALLTGFSSSAVGDAVDQHPLCPSAVAAAGVDNVVDRLGVGVRHSRSARRLPKQNLRPMLELESGSNDPMAYMLTILLVEAVMAGNELSGMTLVLQLLLQFGVGAAGGVALGYVTRKL